MLNKPKKMNKKMRDLRIQFLVDTPGSGLLEWITPPVIALRGWIAALLIEKRKWSPLPWKHRLRAWRHGFSSFVYHLYELQDNSPDDYIPDLVSQRFGRNLNGPYTEIIRSKVAFGRLMKSLDAPQPALLGILIRGYFYPENGDASESLGAIYSLLKKGKKLVLRPSFGGGGVGIFFLEQTQEGYLVNRLAVDSNTLETLLRPLHDYLVTEFVNQATYSAEIAPGSTNTLRILTLWDFDTNRPFIAASCHRFGMQTSGPLDNFHQGEGGLSAPIDLATGELGKAVIVRDRKIMRLSHHPDTGKAIEGVVVPDWHQTTEELLTLAAKFPYAPCVGWDLVKLDEGWVCLEGNSTPGYSVWQVHGPILSDPRARRFYQESGMIT
jgi:hypothetical protein